MRRPVPSTGPSGANRASALPWIAVVLACVLGSHAAEAAAGSGAVDFNRDVRRVLSENCFACHGPDAKPRAGGGKPLRLDLAESALAERKGRRAIVPGKPDESELVARITSTDPDSKMPPPDSGKKLEPDQVALLRRWIKQGGTYSRHWSAVKPTRPALPETKAKGWARNGIDAFILARLEKEGLAPNPEADRAALLRRLSLDLTGLPPSLEELDEFAKDTADGALDRAVTKQFHKPGYGEHWARLWLDQARYADSSGYADDPARTIWAYRDYVIRSFNANKPFDQFTIEQLAGDLLPDPTDEQLVATAFHRNTMTNNEGGTNDEEYRNVAVVDRVNTTMAVWMGTTMACAQCHNHKYDPITQEEYFRLFAVLNNTADADRGDESPVLPLFTPEQKERKQRLSERIAGLEKILRTETPELRRDRELWAKDLQADPAWQRLVPSSVTSAAGATVQRDEDGSVHVGHGGKTDVYTVRIPVAACDLGTAFRIEVFPDERPPGRGVGHAAGNFVVTRVTAGIAPPDGIPSTARFLRIELPGDQKILSLAEVQVWQGTNNIALGGEARQSSTASEGTANRAIDGNTDGRYNEAKSTTHTEASSNPWWEVDLRSTQAVDRIVIWNRTDGSQERLAGFKVLLLDAQREPVWQRTVATPPNPSVALVPDGTRPIALALAHATYSAPDFGASNVLDNPDPRNKGWSIAPRYGETHSLVVVPQSPVVAPAGSQWVLTIEQSSKHDDATIAGFRVYKTADPRAAEFARTPAPILAALREDPSMRTSRQAEDIRRHYLAIAPRLQPERIQLADSRKSLEEIKPYSTVPVLRELAGAERRATRIQRRGNFMDLGAGVTNGLPAAFHAPPPGTAIDRLALARWLVDTNNPLTARVVANRLWESVFGIGLVRTSEEFGAQGDLPSHPELLDWLAVELMEHRWDLQHLLRLMVTSAAYRQSSRVTPELAAQDPDNRLLARGPRFRLSAEMIRDQAMFVSGLLSPKMYGPPVKPAQPKLGLSAAFGSGTDWETSTGEDRYRRALYTTWRRSNPYPSMATFDAPNREVCVVRRERSNTPLQALVTLNDPVYLEAAQALARRMATAGSTAAAKATLGFRLCLGRMPTEPELADILRLFEKTRERFAGNVDKARVLASKPLGDLPKDADPVELAAWTVVGNTYLNLDEMLMKR